MVAPILCGSNAFIVGGRASSSLPLPRDFCCPRRGRWWAGLGWLRPLCIMTMYLCCSHVQLFSSQIKIVLVSSVDEILSYFRLYTVVSVLFCYMNRDIGIVECTTKLYGEFFFAWAPTRSAFLVISQLYCWSRCMLLLKLNKMKLATRDGEKLR